MKSFEALVGGCGCGEPHVGALTADDVAEAALGPLAWGRKPVTKVEQAVAETDLTDVAIDAAVGPASWATRAVEKKATEYADTNPTAKAVKDTAQTVRYGAYVAAGLATLAVVGYFVRSVR